MRLGTAKFYNNEAGLGGITLSNGGSEVDVFAHGVIDEIKPDNIVQFDIECAPKGVKTVRVTVLSAWLQSLLFTFYHQNFAWCWYLP